MTDEVPPNEPVAPEVALVEPSSEAEPRGGYQPVRRRSRLRLWIQLAAGVVLIAIVAVVVVGIVSNQHAEAKKLSTLPVLGPENMASGGVLLSGLSGQIVTVSTPPEKIGHIVPTNEARLSSTVNIVEYVDLQCPYCLEFEATNLNNTAALVADGKATLEIHPIAFLDQSSDGARYSSRAANALACVANYKPLEYINAFAVLYEYQPKEGTKGLTNAQILGYLKKADVSTASVTSCVNSEKFRSWVTATTDAVESGSFDGVATTPSAFQGTPTIFVNGTLYTGSISDAKAFSAFLTSQSASTSG